jgi:hypothetical protein
VNKEKPFNDRRLGNKSRMNREVHVRFREGVGVRFPRATRLVSQLTIGFLAVHILSLRLGVVGFNKKGAVRGCEYLLSILCF